MENTPTTNEMSLEPPEGPERKRGRLSRAYKETGASRQLEFDYPCDQPTDVATEPDQEDGVEDGDQEDASSDSSSTDAGYPWEDESSDESEAESEEDNDFHLMWYTNDPMVSIEWKGGKKRLIRDFDDHNKFRDFLEKLLKKTNVSDLHIFFNPYYRRPNKVGNIPRRWREQWKSFRRVIFMTMQQSNVTSFIQSNPSMSADCGQDHPFENGWKAKPLMGCRRIPKTFYEVLTFEEIKNDYVTFEFTYNN